MQAHLDWRFVCSGNAGASERESIKGKRKATSTLPIRLLWKRNMIRQQPIRITQQCRPHHMLRVLADNNLADREAGSPRVLRASVALEDGETRVFREALSYRGHPMVATHRVAVPKVALESFHIMAPHKPGFVWPRWSEPVTRREDALGPYTRKPESSPGSRRLQSGRLWSLQSPSQ